MNKSIKSYCLIPKIADKRWPYDQYYIGEKDQERRKCGYGENHWSGAESLEWYNGTFLRDTMHGEGDYRWRHKDLEGIAVTYEGHFYCNRMHGYGVMSYPDGRVFDGLFYNNVRWGPGIQTHTNLQEDVGLWRGTQLVRLTWGPQTPNVTLNLNTGLVAKARVEPYRTILTSRVRHIGKVNSAIELLKECGAAPIVASERWIKLYPVHCTDLASQVCHKEAFDHEYYTNDIVDLEVIETIAEIKEEASFNTDDDYSNSRQFYAWNNSDMIIDIMKHCFKHDKQKKSTLDLTTILAGPRSRFKGPAKHELNCRTLLMASYLGHITHVSKLVNLNDVHPDVADSLGNTALMYATCGNHADIAHFLVEAGANVNSYNDSCCTPLGLALMQYACRSKDIAPSGMVQALTQPSYAIPPFPISADGKPTEWNMTRDLPIQNTDSPLTKTGSKTLNRIGALKNSVTSEMTIQKKKGNGPSGENPVSKRKINTLAKPTVTEKDKEQNLEEAGDDMFCEEKRVYNNINTEFRIRVSDLFSIPSGTITTPYLFEVNDMAKGVDFGEEEHKKPLDKTSKKNFSRVIKDTIKPSKDKMWQASDEKDDSSCSSAERNKMETLNRIMSTIVRLLRDGADPRLVRCPEPALWIATVAGSPDLVRHLVQYGADINELFDKGLNYSSLDVAISQPLTYETLDLVRAILECGASTDHRLICNDQNADDTNNLQVPGPTLLHAVLARKNEKYIEEEIRQDLVELLLEYNCSATTQFKGHSALEMAMMKNMDLFDIFIKCPKVDLNAVINDHNQTALVKMFNLQFCCVIPVIVRLQTLTNMLLYGADPLLECQDGDEKYENIFVFAKHSIAQFEPIKRASPTTGSSKTDPRGKKSVEKPKKDEKATTKSQKDKFDHNDLGDYKQALDLVTECARILHIRWIQAKLLKELIKIVEKSKTSLKWPLTAQEKDLIEADVMCILREHKTTKTISMETVHRTRPYVTPELAVGADQKFQVCFECALPLNADKILCRFCKQVSFCSFSCMQLNIERVSCHPCSGSLKMKYFPSPVDSLSTTII